MNKNAIINKHFLNLIGTRNVHPHHRRRHHHLQHPHLLGPPHLQVIGEESGREKRKGKGSVMNHHHLHRPRQHHQ